MADTSMKWGSINSLRSAVYSTQQELIVSEQHEGLEKITIIPPWFEEWKIMGSGKNVLEPLSSCFRNCEK